MTRQMAAFAPMRIWMCLAAICVLAAADARAQVRRPQAALTPSVAKVTANDAQLTVRVKLPDTIHVQSDKPRDPLFIPTALTLQPPPGITLAGVTYPKASELKQANVKEPLLVFGSDFVIDARVSIAADAPRGEVKIPGRLRYQACDEKMCYPPARAEVTWTVNVP